MLSDLLPSPIVFAPVIALSDAFVVLVKSKAEITPLTASCKGFVNISKIALFNTITYSAFRVTQITSPPLVISIHLRVTSPNQLAICLMHSFCSEDHLLSVFVPVEW